MTGLPSGSSLKTPQTNPEALGSGFAALSLGGIFARTCRRDHLREQYRSRLLSENPICIEDVPLPQYALSDSVLASQLSKASALIKVLPDQTFPTDRCQGSVGGVHAWGVRSWAVGTHHNPVGLIPLCQPAQPGGTTQPTNPEQVERFAIALGRICIRCAASRIYRASLEWLHP